jgi:hypothetical protein
MQDYTRAFQDTEKTGVWRLSPAGIATVGDLWEPVKFRNPTGDEKGETQTEEVP